MQISSSTTYLHVYGMSIMIYACLPSYLERKRLRLWLHKGLGQISRIWLRSMRQRGFTVSLSFLRDISL